MSSHCTALESPLVKTTQRFPFGEPGTMIVCIVSVSEPLRALDTDSQVFDPHALADVRLSLRLRRRLAVAAGEQ
jgi:hypothetical protein